MEAFGASVTADFRNRPVPLVLIISIIESGYSPLSIETGVEVTFTTSLREPNLNAAIETQAY